MHHVNGRTTLEFDERIKAKPPDLSILGAELQPLVAVAIDFFVTKRLHRCASRKHHDHVTVEAWRRSEVDRVVGIRCVCCLELIRRFCRFRLWLERFGWFWFLFGLVAGFFGWVRLRRFPIVVIGGCRRAGRGAYSRRIVPNEVGEEWFSTDEDPGEAADADGDRQGHGETDREAGPARALPEPISQTWVGHDGCLLASNTEFRSGVPYQPHGPGPTEYSMGSSVHRRCRLLRRGIHSRRSTLQSAPESGLGWESDEGRKDLMLALSKSDLKRLVSMSDAIDLMKLAFTELSASRAISPVRSVLEVNHDPSAMLIMPALVPAASALGFKVVSFFGGNPTRDLPTIHALVCLVDHETGVPLAIMEGGYVTALRTGAVSGAATDLLARQDSRVLTVIGAGVQGVTQAAAVCAVRPIERILVADTRPDAFGRYAEAIAADWPDLSDRIEPAADVSSAVREADVICTATTARAPVFDDRDLKPGTHINGVGAFTPEMQEVPPATVARSTVVIDSLEAILAEAGDLLKPLHDGLISEEHFHRELGQVADGSAPGRANDDEITFFKSVGNAVQDVVVARRAVDRARDLGLGVTLDLTV